MPSISLLNPQEVPMADITKLRLIQFKAGYNLPVHAGRETGIFERHGFEIEITYTPGSLYISEALRNGQFEIGHTGADDIVADVEDFGSGASLIYSEPLEHRGSTRYDDGRVAPGQGIGRRCARERLRFYPGKTAALQWLRSRRLQVRGDRRR